MAAGNLIKFKNKNKKINVLNKRLEIFKRQISEIDSKLQNVDTDIPLEGLSISYDEKVQINHLECGYAKKALIRITDRLLSEKTYKKEQIADIEKVLRNLEFNNIVIDDVISSLDKEDYGLLKQKYRYGKRDWQIGMLLNMSQSAVSKRKKKLLESIINSL